MAELDSKGLLRLLHLGKPDADPSILDALLQAHPFASDVRKALVGLVPRRFRLQFWQIVDGDLRIEALVDSADLEGELLDASTVDEIARIAVKPRTRGLRDLLDRFVETRDAVRHPLNAEFLDRLLTPLSVADRDIRWSEWIRENKGNLLSDVGAFTRKWQDEATLTLEDHLRAIWLKWLLTSTVRHVRDLATLALYCYGRADPNALFQLTLSGLQANDPYVTERLLAASYGVVMAGPGEQREYGEELTGFLSGLRTAFCDDDARAPTDHWLIREYVDGIVEWLDATIRTSQVNERNLAVRRSEKTHSGPLC